MLVMLTLLVISYKADTNFRIQDYLPLGKDVSTDPLLTAGGAAEYRRLLSAVNPLDTTPHSKTLGVASRMYVIGLPGREDRRILMESLQNAMGKLNINIYNICQIVLNFTRSHIHLAQCYECSFPHNRRNRRTHTNCKRGESQRSRNGIFDAR